MVNVNQKGKRYERAIANYLNKCLGTNVRRTPNSGGLSIKADIIDIDPTSTLAGWHFELKDHKTLGIPRWIQQAEGDASLTRNKPCIIFHHKAKDYALIKLEDFVELLAKQEEK